MSCSEFINRCPHICQVVQVNSTERRQEGKLRSGVQDCESNLFSYTVQEGETGRRFPLAHIYRSSVTQFRGRQKKNIYFMLSGNAMILHLVSGLVRFSTFAFLVGEEASILSSCSDNIFVSMSALEQGLTDILGSFTTIAETMIGGLATSLHFSFGKAFTLSSAPNMPERCEAVDMVAPLSAKNPRRLPDSSSCLLHRQGTVCAV